MPTREERARARREAAPAAVVVLLLFVGLAGVSRAKEWELGGLPWWIWLLVGAPALLLAIDLSLLKYRGRGLWSSRKVDLLLLGLLVLGNLTALALLVDGLVTAKSSDLSGGELLLTGFAIWAADVIVFGLAFWELDAEGPVARQDTPRTPSYFQFPQDENRPHENRKLASDEWHPEVWDYLYVGLTNGIAFSPTDAMPLSHRAKAMMGLESALSAVTVLLVAARAVNILGS